MRTIFGCERGGGGKRGTHAAEAYTLTFETGNRIQTHPIERLAWGGSGVGQCSSSAAKSDIGVERETPFSLDTTHRTLTNTQFSVTETQSFFKLHPK